MDNRIKVKVMLNVAYYLKNDGTLGSYVIEKEGRVSRKVAEEILTKNGIQYDEIFKVKKEEFEVSIKREQLIK